MDSFSDRIAAFFSSIGHLFAPEKDVEELERTIRTLEEELKTYREGYYEVSGTRPQRAIGSIVTKMEQELVPERGAPLIPDGASSYDVLKALPAEPAVAAKVLEGEVVRLREEKQAVEASLSRLEGELKERRERVKKLGAALFDAAVFE